MIAAPDHPLHPVAFCAEELNRLIAHSSPEWFRRFHAKNPAAEQAVLRRQFAQARSAGGCFAGVADVRGQLVAAAALSPLPWDTDWFGMRMGRISPLLVSNRETPQSQRAVVAVALHEVLERAGQEGYGMLVRRVLDERYWEQEALQQAGFRHVDTLSTMIGATSEASRPEHRFRLSPLSLLDLDAALAIMPGQFPHSRFCLDPRLAIRGEGVYLNWLRNSLLSKTSALGVAAFDPHGELAGFTLWSEIADEDAAMRERVGSLDLFVVAHHHRGCGCGTALLAATLASMHRVGIGQCEASTWVENEAALAAYRRACFVERAKILSYHN